MLVVASLRLEVLRVLRKLEYKLSRKDYLQINAFPDLVVVEQEDILMLYKEKPLEEPRVKW